MSVRERFTGIKRIMTRCGNRDLIGQRELLQLSMETANNRIDIIRRKIINSIRSDIGTQ